MSNHRIESSNVYLAAAFWYAVLERAIKTAAQSAIAAIGTTALIQEVDWAVVGGATAIATLLSILTSIASANIGSRGPGIGPETLE